MEIFLMVLIMVILLASMWVVFAKSGVSGWKSIIPVYSNLVLLKIVELPFWYIFLYLIPVVNLYAIFKTYIRLAHKFGRSTLFGVCLTILYPLVLPVLAMSDKDDKIEEKSAKKSATSNLAKIILVTILLSIILTWIFPITYFGYSLTEEAKMEVGLFELFSYGPTIFNYFGTVIFYVLAIGGFYGVLHKIDGYRNLLDKIANKFKGKECVFLCVVMILLAIITSMAGLTNALLFLFPFLISIILVMGYDKTTAALTTVGSVAVGLIGTTVSATNINAIVGILELDFSSELLTKAIILVVGLVLLIFNVLRYAKKHKVEKVEKDNLPVSNDSKKRSWPIVVIIDIVLITMILASISWETVLGVKVFNTFHETVKTFEIGGFAIFGKLLGETNVLAFGNWTLADFTLLLTLSAGIIALCYKKKFNEFFEAYLSGMKKAVKPAVLIFLAYIVLVITATHPVLLAIFKPILTATSGFNVFTMSLVSLISSVFSIEPYYIATTALPYAASIIKDTTTYPLIAVVWQSMQGLAILIAPTSVVLIATLSYLDISFWKWIKASWKLILEILVALLLIFTILILI